MPSKRPSNDLVLFSSTNPQQLVQWLCETYGFQAVLQAVAKYQPRATTTEAAPTKRAYKRRAKKGTKKAGKKAGNRGRKGSKKGSKKSAQSEESS